VSSTVPSYLLEFFDTTAKDQHILKMDLEGNAQSLGKSNNTFMTIPLRFLNLPVARSYVVKQQKLSGWHLIANKLVQSYDLVCPSREFIFPLPKW